MALTNVGEETVAKPNEIPFDSGKEGRGADYKPFFQTHQVPSIGLSTRIKGWKTKRTHHLLSKLELFYFYNLEWFSSVVDVREQYPLDLQHTIEIADEMKIRHPGYMKGVTYVMTTDFLITVKKEMGVGELARTVKYSQELSKPRVIEKFEIERVYWNSRGVDWGIVTEKEIDSILAQNIEWLHPYQNIKLCSPLDEDIISRLIPLLEIHLSNQSITLSELTITCDVQLGLKTGVCLAAVRHLLATRRLKDNMHSRIEPSKKISELELTISN
jgi:hypothetical protein